MNGMMMCVTNELYSNTSFIRINAVYLAYIKQSEYEIHVPTKVKCWSSQN